MKKLSICIPAYNRANKLEELLSSIINQNFKDYQIVIAEDYSAERKKISQIVLKYKKKYPDIDIKYFENESNFGYDKNYRRLIDLAEGKYCFFMGNDDLVYPNGLNSISRILDSYSNIGVVIRSYATFKNDPNKLIEIFKYSKNELYLPPGPKSIAYSFRRSVIGSGMVYERESAKRFHTNIFDGTLLYQIYLVSRILEEKYVVFNPEITVLYRLGGIPDFGNSKNEKNKFTPKKQTIESSINFMKGMIDIAKYAGRNEKEIFRLIIKDISIYSYPIISIQSHRNKKEFMKYIFSLIKIGIGNNILFYIYVIGLLFLGKKFMDIFIILGKKLFGSTPNFFK